MDFGEVLRRAWQITWKFKILWIFGIFAGCSRGGGGGSGGGGNSGTQFNQPGAGPSNEFPQLQQYATQFGDWISSHLWIVALIVLFFLAIIVLTIWLGTMGRIGLIKGTLKADGGAEHLGFGELWSESGPFFWRIFLLSLLVGLAFLVLLVPAFLIGFATAGVGFLCLIPLFCILIPVGILVGVVLQQAEAAIVIEDLSITDGVRRGWEVFRGNLGPMLIMWLILLAIGIVAGIVLALPVLIVVVPAVIAFGAGSSGQNLSYTPLLVAGICFAVYLPFLWLLNGILTTYLQSAWALTFLRLTRPKVAPEAAVLQAPNA